MNKRFTTERASFLAFLLCMTVYVLVSLARNAYPAAMAAMIADGVFTKSDAGLINASFYFFYGATTLLGGILADRVSPFFFMFITLFGSGAACAVMGFSNSLLPMVIAWGLYGLASFAVWPAIVKVMSSMLMEKHKRIALLTVPFGVNIGTMLSYLTAAPILNAGGWRSLFIVTAVVFAVAVVAFCLVLPYFKKRLAEVALTEPMQNALPIKKTNHSLFRLMSVSGIFLLLMPNFVRGALDVGLKTWVPTMIMENYGVSSSFAGTITTVLLVVNLLAIFLVAWMYPRRCRNAAVAVGIYFAVSVPMIAVLFWIGQISLAVTILVLALVTTLMSAAAQFFNASFAADFASYGKNGLISGILNTAGCLGCVAANYGYGAIAEHFGWTVTIGVWVAMAVIALVFCLLAVPKWERFRKGKF